MGGVREEGVETHQCLLVQRSLSALEQLFAFKRKRIKVNNYRSSFPLSQNTEEYGLWANTHV